MEVSPSPSSSSSSSSATTSITGTEPASSVRYGSLLYFLRSESPPCHVQNREVVQVTGNAEAAENENQYHLRFIDEAVVGGSGWKAVEDRFNRVAKIGPRPVPVITASVFAYCFGMQKTPEFASELLRALRGRKDQSIKITKPELQNLWHRVSSPCFDSRAQIFFDLCDSNLDGKLTHNEIKQAIMLSFSSNKLSISQKEAEEYSALIMEEHDTESQGYIEVSQLKKLLKLRSSKKHYSSLKPSPHYYSSKCSIHQDVSARAEILLRTYWRRAWVVILWLVICIALFGWKFTQYRHREAYKIMGYCLCTAKGAAETLKFNMALVLLPVCRNTVTLLRKNRRISSVVPFNDNINFHKLIAGGIVVGVILHGGTHLACDFPRITGSNNLVFQETIAARFRNHQPSYVEILTTTEVVTGVAMVVLMTIAFSLATKWPRRQSPSLPKSIRQVTGFNTFWYSHHLFVLVYVLLIIHSMFLFLPTNTMEKTAWMYIIVPVLLYCGERAFRAIRSELKHIQILKATTFPGKVLSLKMSKPEGFNYRSGMYIYIQCPQISPFEWHPFSLTSAPEDDHLSVHIRALGDWSYQMYSLFQEAIVSAGTMDNPRIYIDGPYGAASQDHVKYDVLVFIGLGIGITPFISILKDILYEIQNPDVYHSYGRHNNARKCPSKAYLYWVTREQCSFEWFREFMKIISETYHMQNVIEIHSFLTSMYQDNDARSALIGAIQALNYAKNGIDIISRTKVPAHMARPNWPKIFSHLAQQHHGQRIGLFYCGSLALAREIEALCTKFSTKSGSRFIFHKENY